MKIDAKSTRRRVMAVDKDFMFLAQQYQEIHKLFDSLRGKKLSDEEVDSVLKLLDDMKEVYKSLNEVINFIDHRRKNSDDIKTHFHGFINEMQKIETKN